MVNAEVMADAKIMGDALDDEAQSCIEKFRRVKGFNKTTVRFQIQTQLGKQENLLNTVVELDDLPGILKAQESDVEVGDEFDVGETTVRIRVGQELAGP